MSTRLYLSKWLIRFLCFHFDALTELGALMLTDFFFMYFCIKSNIGNQGEDG